MKKIFFLPFWAVLLILGSLLVSCGNSANSQKSPVSDDMSADTDNLDVAPPADDMTIPSIYISTEDGVNIPDTKEDVNCTVRLVSGTASQCKDNLSATVRCRGNGSMYVGKKTGKFPYKLKFEDKINPFGVGKGKEKDWVLLASVGEHTMLRNYAAKYMGQLLTGIPYSPCTQSVNLYINGSYAGVYELTEQMEAKDSRVDINDNLKGDVNGFLVELDAYAGRTETENSFAVRENYFAVKSNVFSETQLNYIKNYIEQVDSAIYAGDSDKLAQLVDIDSLVDMYILQEYVKNIDVGFSSFYMYKDVTGKMYFAPPWDFDLTFGNDKRLDNGSYEGLYVAEGREGLVQNSKWYICLMGQQWFYDLVCSRWAEVSESVIPQVIDAVRAEAQKIAPVMEYNYKRWNFMGKFMHQEPDAIVALTTYQEHVDYLIDWMENRKAWLNSEFQKPFSKTV